MVTAALLQTCTPDDQERTTTSSQRGGIIEGTGTRIGSQDTVRRIGHIAGGTFELWEFAEDTPESEHISEYILDLDEEEFVSEFL